MRNFATGCIVLFTMAGTAFGETKEPPKKLAADLGGGVKMELVLIPAGEFKMGSAESAEDTAAFFNKTYAEDFLKADFFKDEHPQHRVRITKPFYLGTYHVTRGQFRQFVADAGYKTDAEKGELPGAWGWDPDNKQLAFNAKYSWRDPGFEQTDDHPVVEIDHNDASAFCQWLGEKEKRRYHLPTEAQWEYACRAGTQTAYFWGNDADAGKGFANCFDWAAKEKLPVLNSFNWSDGFVYTSPVGSFKPNAWGLYDMIGNALEWCADYYAPYPPGDEVDPTGPAQGDEKLSRVLRGGSWFYTAPFCRAAYRAKNAPGARYFDFGFRVALDVP